ncbi:MAG: 4'-phosphopantetheinyl transferase superfamily protein [Propionibacteriaceae bacterium]|jgi:4'-phosphopantetheinyl transferase|nr:4'-phosphopantetheinyl transferase superfamily protein [Propionibacteriaceae bacterium]
MGATGSDVVEDVEVVVIGVDAVDEALVAAWLPHLSAHRRAKIERQRHERERRLRLGAGIALDCALRRHGMSEAAMDYETDEDGAVRLLDADGLNVSLSHSGDFAVCALGRCPLGVDVERVRHLEPGVVTRFFDPREDTALRTLPAGSVHDDAVVRLWTLKESVVKATHVGLETALRTYAFDLASPPRLLDRERGRGLWFAEGDPALTPGHRLSLCCTIDDPPDSEGEVVPVVCWTRYEAGPPRV